MHTLRRPTILLTGLAVIASTALAPSAAYAADTSPTPIAPSAVIAEWTAIRDATDLADDEGYRYVETIIPAETENGPSENGTVRGTATTTYDAAQNNISVTYATKAPSVTPRDYYLPSTGGTIAKLSANERLTAAYMGKKNAQWSYDPVAVHSSDTAAPSTFLTEVVGYLTSPEEEDSPLPTITEASVTTDGTSRTITAEIIGTGDTASRNFTVEITANQNVASAVRLSENDDVWMNATYTYGSFTVTPPPLSAALSAVQLAEAESVTDYAYHVSDIASRARKSVKASQKTSAKVATLRKTAKDLSAFYNNRSPKDLYRATNVANGVRITETNPYTKKKQSYTVKVSGKKITIRKS